MLLLKGIGDWEEAGRGETERVRFVGRWARGTSAEIQELWLLGSRKENRLKPVLPPGVFCKSGKQRT